MDEAQESLGQDGSEDEVMGSMGVAPEAEESGDSVEQDAQNAKDDPYSVKKRLGMQAKRHQREMRAMQEQIAHMQARMGQHSNVQYDSDVNPYPSPGQPSAPVDTEEQRIQKAVRYALQAKEAEERKAKDVERHAHVQKQYERLHQEFDKASDKYDDFDDVVRDDNVPFTPHVRDALLLVDNPAEVAYKLGKNREELMRISQLHPLDQAREVNKLSFALMGGNHGKPSSSSRPNPIGQVKANPANNSSAVTEKTPVSSIRARMKQGTWK